MEQAFNNPEANTHFRQQSCLTTSLGELILGALSCRLQNLMNKFGKQLAPSFST